MRSFTVAEKNVFEILEFLTSNIMLPLGGLCIVLFIGWFFSPSITKAELTNEGQLKGRLIPIFMFIVKFIAPLAIAMILLYSLGVFKSV